MAFFFPETMLKRIKKIDNNLSFKYGDFSELDKALVEFNTVCREYIGLGYFSSFIPGTRAYTAREQLSNKINLAISAVDKTLEALPNISNRSGKIYLFLRWGSRAALKGAVVDKLMMRPLWEVLDHSFEQHFQLSMMAHNYKRLVIRILSFLPILSSIYFIDEDRKFHFYSGYEILSNLFHSLRNPVRLVNQALFFSHFLVDRIIEIGSVKYHGEPSTLDRYAGTTDENYGQSGIIRGGLKIIVSIAFTLVTIPVKASEKLLDVPYDLVKNLIYKPIRFICLSVYDKFCKKNQAQVISKIDEEQSPLLNAGNRKMYTTIGRRDSQHTAVVDDSPILSKLQTQNAVRAEGVTLVNSEGHDVNDGPKVDVVVPSSALQNRRV